MPLRRRGARAAHQGAARAARVRRWCAPRSRGTIYKTQAKKGEMVRLGDPLLWLADLEHLRVRANVDQVDLGRVQPGQRVVVSANAFPGRTWTGMITEIVPHVVVKESRSVSEGAGAHRPADRRVGAGHDGRRRDHRRRGARRAAGPGRGRVHRTASRSCTASKATASARRRCSSACRASARPRSPAVWRTAPGRGRPAPRGCATACGSSPAHRDDAKSKERMAC